MTTYLQPKFFLSGLLLGFIFCCVAGYFVSTKARLNHFSRFYMAIEPQTLYYPTASELLQTTRHKVSRDKILVLVGGSSIFKGVGQDPNEVWTDKLQQRLGDKFKVLNYATDGASFSSYGGVVFRMLRKEYPKLIFVAAAYQFNSEGDMDGLAPYDYLFWDAYYKKLFNPYPKEAEKIKELRKREMNTALGKEQHLMAFLDSYCYFRNLWNWVSYRFIFTMFSDYEFGKPFQARHKYYDEPIPPDYKQILIKANRDSEHFKNYQEFMLTTVRNYLTDVSKTPFHVQPSIVDSGLKGYDEVFQPQDRHQILMVQTTYNTHIISSLPKKFQEGYWFVSQQSQLMMKSLGYHVIDVGKDFTGDDYIDIDHFLGSGGNKLSLKVADEVKRIAVQHGWKT